MHHISSGNYNEKPHMEMIELSLHREITLTINTSTFSPKMMTKKFKEKLIRTNDGQF